MFFLGQFEQLCFTFIQMLSECVQLFFFKYCILKTCAQIKTKTFHKHKKLLLLNSKLLSKFISLRAACFYVPEASVILSEMEEKSKGCVPEVSIL